MKQSGFAAYWVSAAELYGLSVVSPFRLSLTTGETIVADCLLQGYGARNGMILVEDYSLIEPHLEELVKSGYGYSVLSTPASTPTKDDIQDLLRDWGQSLAGDV